MDATVTDPRPSIWSFGSHTCFTAGQEFRIVLPVGLHTEEQYDLVEWFRQLVEREGLADTRYANTMARAACIGTDAFLLVVCPLQICLSLCFCVSHISDC